MEIKLAMSEREARALATWLDEGGSLDGDLAEVVAHQIVAQLPKPRIPEPGLYSVVRDGNGWDWVRAGIVHSTSCEWLCCETGDFGNWPDIDSPTLIREGI